MNVKIWSDIRCPFCYIGKHRFEKALEKFSHKDKVDVSWYSFELDPNLKTEPDISTLDHLTETKGLTRDQVEQMLKNAREMAKEVGLTLDFKNAVVANSFNAHRLIQFAKKHGLDNELEEALFKAHFKSGKNIDNRVALREIGVAVGLKEAEVDTVLFTDAYEKEVRRDQKIAAQLGIRGVPFFVFNDKYAISGAQSEAAFLQTLEKTWEEFDKNDDTSLNVKEGKSCSTDDSCD